MSKSTQGLSVKKKQKKPKKKKKSKEEIIEDAKYATWMTVTTIITVISISTLVTIGGVKILNVFSPPEIDKPLPPLTERQAEVVSLGGFDIPLPEGEKSFKDYSDIRLNYHTVTVDDSTINDMVAWIDKKVTGEVDGYYLTKQGWWKFVIPTSSQAYSYCMRGIEKDFVIRAEALQEGSKASLAVITPRTDIDVCGQVTSEEEEDNREADKETGTTEVEDKDKEEEE